MNSPTCPSGNSTIFSLSSNQQTPHRFDVPNHPSLREYRYCLCNLPKQRDYLRSGSLFGSKASSGLLGAVKATGLIRWPLSLPRVSELGFLPFRASAKTAGECHPILLTGQRSGRKWLAFTEAKFHPSNWLQSTWRSSSGSAITILYGSNKPWGTFRPYPRRRARGNFRRQSLSHFLPN